jgi:hypothetical protein
LIFVSCPATRVVCVPAGLSFGAASMGLWRIAPVAFYIWSRGWPP